MLWASSTFLALSLIPSLAYAGLFPKNGPVKMLDEAGFKKVMKSEETTMVAFVAPWCGHCKNLQPEYAQAARSLHPIIPLYAVDCDEDKNKRLCSEQGVKGFPTIKSFHRGGKLPGQDYQGERKAGAIVKYISDKVPNRITPLKGLEKIEEWAKKESSTPRALLLTPKPRTPVMWKVLQTKFNKKIAFGAAKDEDGSIAASLGVTGETKDKSHVLVWEAGSERPVVYDGALKFEPLLKHMRVVAGDKKAKDEL